MPNQKSTAVRENKGKKNTNSPTIPIGMKNHVYEDKVQIHNVRFGRPQRKQFQDTMWVLD